MVLAAPSADGGDTSLLEAKLKHVIQALELQQKQIDTLVAKKAGLEAEVKALSCRVEKLEAGNRGAEEKPPPPTAPPPPEADPTRDDAIEAVRQIGARPAAEPETAAAEYTNVATVGYALSAVSLGCLAVEIPVAAVGGADAAAEWASVHQLLTPLAITGQFVHLYGTLDSSEAGAAAVRHFRAFWGGFAGLICIYYVVIGEYVVAVVRLVVYGLGGAYYAAGMLAAMRERLRARFEGGLAEKGRQYMTYLFSLFPLQLGLLVQGLAQGIGARGAARNLAIGAFSGSLSTSYVFGVGVYDAGEADPKRLARLRLLPREAGAVGATAVYGLTALAAYVLSEQNAPDEAAVGTVFLTLIVAGCVAWVLVGRVVAAANRDTSGGGEGAAPVVQNPLVVVHPTSAPPPTD